MSSFYTTAVKLHTITANTDNKNLNLLQQFSLQEATLEDENNAVKMQNEIYINGRETGQHQELQSAR